LVILAYPPIPIDGCEVMDVVHAFAPKGSCPWCDRHQGWAEEAAEAEACAATAEALRFEGKVSASFMRFSADFVSIVSPVPTHGPTMRIR
jgi:hypothetical protein